MSNRSKRGVRLMAGILVAVAGAFPSNVVTLLEKIVTAVTNNPFRAILVIVGVGLIVSTFWDGLLDNLGIQTNRRLVGKIKDWLHSTFNYSLIETKFEHDTFTVVTEFIGRRFTIKKSATKPVLAISTTVNAPNDLFKKLIEVATGADRKDLCNNIVLELARLRLHGIQVSVTDKQFETTFSHYVLINSDLDGFKLMEGIGVVTRGGILVDAVVAKWTAARVIS